MGMANILLQGLAIGNDLNHLLEFLEVQILLLKGLS